MLCPGNCSLRLTGVNPALVGSAVLLAEVAQRLAKLVHLHPLCEPAIHHIRGELAGVLCFLPARTGFIVLRGYPDDELLELEVRGRGTLDLEKSLALLERTFKVGATLV